MTEPETETRTANHSNQAFHAIVRADTIQRSIALVHALVDECRLHLDADGVRITAIDPATVAAVDLELGSAAFESYEATGGRLGVDLTRLDEIVGLADRDQFVRFELDAETRTLQITIDDLEYTLGLLDPETIRSPPDRTDLALDSPGEVVLAAEQIGRAVKAGEMVSDQIAFGIDESAETFYAEAEGDTDDVSLAQDANELVEFSPADAHSLFSVEYLAAINREMPNGTEVDVQIGTEEPLVADFEFAEGDGSVTYLVSPRIANY
ncbi:DNA polymerase sliding clamp [Halostella sp. PRR32]|uniref:DNA polymerase sliding clamp n=1 Tax=Halostella sp. PRR32 TaxID=3098147 RepID=UPI002B1E32D4|nr:DNA polymerase sliding clamp [Halostella sp. PRR32]